MQFQFQSKHGKLLQKHSIQNLIIKHFNTCKNYPSISKIVFVKLQLYLMKYISDTRAPFNFSEIDQKFILRKIQDFQM